MVGIASKKATSIYQELLHKEFELELPSFCSPPSEPSAFLSWFINRSFQRPKVVGGRGRGGPREGWQREDIVPRELLKHLLPGVCLRILPERVPAG